MQALVLMLAMVGQAPVSKAAPPVVVTTPAPVVVAVTPPLVATPSIQPSISGPTTIYEHTLTSFSVPGFDQVAWLVIPSISTDTNGGKLDITGPPGSYTIIAAVVQNGKPVFLTQILTVQATPTPVASATPQSPAVAAAPKATGLWAFAMFDAATMTSIPPGQLAIHNSQTLKPALEAMGVHYQELPKLRGDNDRWGAAMAGIALPAMGVTDANGTFVLAPMPLPANEAGVIAAIKGLTK